jgi:hypothetical protein
MLGEGAFSGQPVLSKRLSRYGAVLSSTQHAHRIPHPPFPLGGAPGIMPHPIPKRPTMPTRAGVAERRTVRRRKAPAAVRTEPLQATAVL